MEDEIDDITPVPQRLSVGPAADACRPARQRAREARRFDGRVVLLVAVLLVAVNRRGAIAGTAPLLPQIRADLELGPGVAGLLTSLPVLCFALAAPLAAWLGRVSGFGRAVLVGLLAVAAGAGLRVLDGSAALLAGTVVLGVGITVGNVLVPAVAKRDFGKRAAGVTGLYTAALVAGAAVAAAVAVPVADVGGWRLALGVWAGPALAATVVWWLADRSRRAVAAPSALGAESSPAALWRSGTAWAVAAFLGVQALPYYALTAWLPTLLADEVGVDGTTAGAAAAVFQALGIVGALAATALATRRADQVHLGAAVALAWLATVVGLLVRPEAWPLWTVLGGVAQGAAIALALTLVVVRARDSAVARELSSMAQFVGYAFGATGPVVVGLVRGWTGGWTAPLLLLGAVCVAMGVAAVLAGRDGTVGQRPAGS